MVCIFIDPPDGGILQRGPIFFSTRSWASQGASEAPWEVPGDLEVIVVKVSEEVDPAAEV